MDSNSSNLNHEGSEAPPEAQGLENPPQGLQPTSPDLSEVEKQLIQSRKLQAIGSLVGGIAHDFNNVLGAIQVQVELMQQTNSIEPAAQILNSVGSAKAIVQQLLNWSRPSNHQSVPISLNRVVEESIPLLSTFATRFIKIHFEPTPCQDVILAESNQINQILLNLCSNAANAMKSNGGRITIEVSEADVSKKIANVFDLDAGPHVMLQVTDNGCGIPPELMQRIQDPQFCASPIEVSDELGLWTVFRIAKSFNGQVFVESEENVGTAFKIYFPLSHETETFPDQQVAPANIKKTDGIRLLVVDDESAIVLGLEQLLNISGHQARGFTSSCEALKAFVDAPDDFDMVITDQVMPLISGEELIREIKAIRPDIPVVLCSGYSEIFQRADASKQQADAYFEKPFQFTELLALIKKLHA